MNQYNGYNGYYTTVYPQQNPIKNDKGIMMSPFVKNPIKSDTNYLAKINYNVFLANGNYFMVYYILFNGTPENPTYTIKYVTIDYTNNNTAIGSSGSGGSFSVLGRSFGGSFGGSAGGKLPSWQKSSLDFTFKTESNTFNFGIYLVSCKDNGNRVTSLEVNWPSYSGVSIYEMPN